MGSIRNQSGKRADSGNANTTARNRLIIKSNFTPKDFASVAENQPKAIGIARFAGRKFKRLKNCGGINAGRAA